jgi:hypothetical protein
MSYPWNQFFLNFPVWVEKKKWSLDFSHTGTVVSYLFQKTLAESLWSCLRKMFYEKSNMYFIVRRRTVVLRTPQNHFIFPPSWMFVVHLGNIFGKLQGKRLRYNSFL